ncbi:MAG: serine hydrolase [Flavobacteriales bacterium]|nr:serine hydrolase [Flavobacteriales bacterium]
MKKLKILILLCAMSTGSKGQSLYFPPIEGNEWDTMSPESLGWCQERIDSLFNFLDSQNTKAFILLKDGKIVLEQYFNGHTQVSPWQWASAGKTITSFMVGMAQQDGFLSISDETASYLGEGWTICTPEQESQITIRHQLTMTSGLNDGVVNNHCTLDTCLEYLADAGARWAYHNAPYTLLDSVIHQATGQTLNAYTNVKLKTPTGMTGIFVPLEDDNVFFSNARSMARFGLLILNHGTWDGNTIMSDETYFNQMLNTSQSLNESYGYLWWLNGKPSYMIPQLQFTFDGPLFPHGPMDCVAAMGKDGQFINVVESENMVWIRMGESPDDLPVPFLLNDSIWEYVSTLSCLPDHVLEGEYDHGSLPVFYDAKSNMVKVLSPEKMNDAVLFNVMGQRIISVNSSDLLTGISMEAFSPGIYYLRVLTKDNQIQVFDFVKE